MTLLLLGYECWHAIFWGPKTEPACSMVARLHIDSELHDLTRRQNGKSSYEAIAMGDLEGTLRLDADRTARS